MADAERLYVDGAGGKGLLADLGGAKPPAPAWFDAALAHAPARSRFPVEGAEVELLTWGEVGRPGLLLMHGNGAHADWWSFLAPLLADRYRVAAFSWSGMGGSDWRSAGYRFSMFAKEAQAAAEAAGLYAAPVKPVMLAHSFGGFIALYIASRFGERFGGAVVIDAAIDPPGHTHDRPPLRSRPNRIYPTFDEALARFRLAPPQPCENLFAIDFIARHSLKEAEGGVTWKFDPFIWREFELGDMIPLLKRPGCPLALMWGAKSRLVTPEVARFMASETPEGTPAIEIPEAEHHLMLDQPLAFIAATRALLSAWPR